MEVVVNDLPLPVMGSTPLLDIFVPSRASLFHFYRILLFYYLFLSMCTNK